MLALLMHLKHVSVLDSGAEGPGFKSQARRYRVTVLGKLFTPTAPLFIKQQNWKHQSVKFDFTADLTGTGNRSEEVIT